MKRLLPFLSPLSFNRRECSHRNRWTLPAVVALLFISASQCFALTAADILTRARVLLRDTSSDTTRQRFSDTQLLNWLNDGQREANAFGFVLQSSYTFQLVSGTTEYALPTDFLTPWRVTYKGRKIEQTSFNQQDATSVAWQTQSVGTPNGYYIYLASSPTIGFVPAPSSTSTGTIVVWYIQQTTDMTTTTQVPFNSWSQLIPYHSGLAYFIAYRGLWAIGDQELASNYLQEWQQWIQALKAGIGRQPDFTPGFSGRRNQ